MTPAEQVKFLAGLAARRCERCGQNLDAVAFVWLELDKYTGRYHEPGQVAADASQGLFPFGAACASRVLQADGVNRRIGRAK